MSCIVACGSTSPAVNRLVAGSNPARGAKLFSHFVIASPPTAGSRLPKPRRDPKGNRAPWHQADRGAGCRPGLAMTAGATPIRTRSAADAKHRAIAAPVHDDAAIGHLAFDGFDRATAMSPTVRDGPAAVVADLPPMTLGRVDVAVEAELGGRRAGQHHERDRERRGEKSLGHGNPPVATPIGDHDP